MSSMVLRQHEGAILWQRLFYLGETKLTDNIRRNPLLINQLSVEILENKFRPSKKAIHFFVDVIRPIQISTKLAIIFFSTLRQAGLIEGGDEIEFLQAQQKDPHSLEKAILNRAFDDVLFLLKHGVELPSNSPLNSTFFYILCRNFSPHPRVIKTLSILVTRTMIAVNPPSMLWDVDLYFEDFNKKCGFVHILDGGGNIALIFEGVPSWILAKNYRLWRLEPDEALYLRSVSEVIIGLASQELRNRCSPLILQKMPLPSLQAFVQFEDAAFNSDLLEDPRNLRITRWLNIIDQLDSLQKEVFLNNLSASSRQIFVSAYIELRHDWKAEKKKLAINLNDILSVLDLSDTQLGKLAPWFQWTREIKEFSEKSPRKRLFSNVDSQGVDVMALIMHAVLLMKNVKLWGCLTPDRLGGIATLMEIYKETQSLRAQASTNVFTETAQILANNRLEILKYSTLRSYLKGLPNEDEFDMDASDLDIDDTLNFVCTSLSLETVLRSEIQRGEVQKEDGRLTDEELNLIYSSLEYLMKEQLKQVIPPENSLKTALVEIYKRMQSLSAQTSTSVFTKATQILTNTRLETLKYSTFRSYLEELPNKDGFDLDSSDLDIDETLNLVCTSLSLETVLRSKIQKGKAQKEDGQLTNEELDLIYSLLENLMVEQLKQVIPPENSLKRAVEACIQRLNSSSVDVTPKKICK